MERTLTFDYSPEKNTYLKKTHGISFEEIELAIEEGGLLDIIEHPNTNKYPGQKIYVVNYNNYVHLVPFVKKSNVAFFKTIIPSRKFTKIYLSNKLL